jgi:ring-1,2-phenylacetyl-CoA epoxidase subunit PaaB
MDESHGGPGPRYEVYEVFAQTTAAGPYQHQASLIAASPEMALVLARENFLRRRLIFGIWVVPRSHIAAAPSLGEDPDWLFRLPKTYREVSDYRDLVDRWRRHRQRAMTPETMT